MESTSQALLTPSPQSKSFLLKYSPTSLNQFILAEDKKQLLYSALFSPTTNSLSNLLLIGKTGHGKSTLLSILVNEYYNGIPQREQKNYILTINNLKEQGVQYYREDMKSFCQSRNSIHHSDGTCRKKLILIDNLDTVTEQNQQILCNLIDKYANPNTSRNVIFLTTCTTTQNIIDALQSRLFLFQIPPLSSTHLYEIAQHVITTEKIQVEDAALNYVLQICNSNVRQLLNYLEKFMLLCGCKCKGDEGEGDEKGERTNVIIIRQLAATLSTDIHYSIFEQYMRQVLSFTEQSIVHATCILYELYDNGYSVMDILTCFYQWIMQQPLTHCAQEDEKDENSEGMVLRDDVRCAMIPIICRSMTMFYRSHEEKIELLFLTNKLNICLKELQNLQTI